MKLLHLGELPCEETQAIYHAMARTGQEGLVICCPSSRCVCLGLHDDLLQEVDTDYCRNNEIPLVRREIGGGVVLLEPGQIFFQLVLSRRNPLLDGSRNQFFHRFLQPAVATLADFQIDASISPPADIVVKGRKISGNGAGDINGMAVYTGNILLSFDRRTMANILNLPGALYREMTRVSMERYLTTMVEEMGKMPDAASVEQNLIRHFATWLGELQPAGYTEELKQETKKSAEMLSDREFLELPGKRSTVRQIKVNEKTYLRFCPSSGRQSATPGYAAQLFRNGVVCDLDSAEHTDEQKTGT